jgi:dienelactone hydrolase
MAWLRAGAGDEWRVFHGISGILEEDREAKMVIRNAILFLLLSIMGAGLANAASPSNATPEKTGAEKVSFDTSDGFFLKGDYYPGKAGGPVVLLLHQLGSTHSDFTALAKLLQSKGMNALAYDARGHGESTMKGGESVHSVSYKDFDRRDFLSMTEDIAAALKFLKNKKNVGEAPVGIVGASIQSSTGLIYAVSHKEVKALVLLSPGLSYRDIDTLKPMKEYGKRPVFIVAGEDDLYSFESANELNKAAVGEKKLEVYINNAGHGAQMFPKAPELPLHIADWLSTHLK